MKLFSQNTEVLSRRSWFLCLLALYVVLELSFNHRLLEMAGGQTGNATATQWQSLEFWARFVSGLGLALLLMRWLDTRIRSRVVLALFCVCAGLVGMWHAQKMLVDAIVASASRDDMLMSVWAHIHTSEALSGRMSLRGLPVLDGPAPSDLRPVMQALWSSSVLGLAPDDLEATSGAAQLAAQWVFAEPAPQQMRDAYRKAVMTPVALGASLWFGLLNLCQLFTGLTAVCTKQLTGRAMSRKIERSVLVVLMMLCTGLSWWSGNAWVQSPGYNELARPALWQGKPFLAPFVDWSLRAEPAWSDPVAWMHRQLLRGFDFHVPVLLGLDESR